MSNANAVWYLWITFDRRVAYPNETIFASATIRNPNAYPIFVGLGYWTFSCYPMHDPGAVEINQVVPPGESIAVPPWRLPIPNVIAGQYEAQVSFDTWSWDASENKWEGLGRVYPARGEPFHIIHQPRFRAFVSRSNRDVDRPIVESITAAIQRWGFDTHTVGINEIEGEGRVPERIVQEIAQADCVFAIATPRDVSSITNLVKTFTWLHNEVAFSFMAQKLTLLIADETVVLSGLAGMERSPTIRYRASELHSFMLQLHQLMPLIRNVLAERSYSLWKQARIEELEKVRYEAFIAGMVVQKRLSLEACEFGKRCNT